MQSLCLARLPQRTTFLSRSGPVPPPLLRALASDRREAGTVTGTYRTKEVSVDRTKKSEDVAGFDPCPECGHPENPPENRFCGRCGTSLERLSARRGELASQAQNSGVTLKERFLPDGLRPVGKTVAVGLAIVTTEVGLAWLRHRLEKKAGQPALPHNVVSREWRAERPGSGSEEHLRGYFLKEVAFLVRDEREIRGWSSSELTIKSSRIAR